MILCQTVGIVALLALNKDSIVQDISNRGLGDRLHQEGQIMIEPLEVKRYLQGVESDMSLDI